MKLSAIKAVSLFWELNTPSPIPNIDPPECESEVSILQVQEVSLCVFNRLIIRHKGIALGGQTKVDLKVWEWEDETCPPRWDHQNRDESLQRLEHCIIEAHGGGSEIDVLQEVVVISHYFQPFRGEMSTA